MSITAKLNGLNLFAGAVGHKILRGGRVSKRGGQVVSYSPHVAELLGSASRAAIGGALVLGSAFIAPVAMADVPSVCDGTSDIVCSGPSGMTQGVSVPNNGTVTLDETLDLDVDAYLALEIAAEGAVVVTGEAGSFIGGTGDGLFVTSRGQTDIVLATDFEVGGTAVVVLHSSDDDLNLTVSGMIDAAETGLAVHPLGSGSAVVTNDGEIYADTGIAVFSDGTGAVSIINSNLVVGSEHGLFAVQMEGASGDTHIENNSSIGISGDDGVGIEVNNLLGDGGNITVVNTGVITDQSAGQSGILDAAINVNGSGTGIRVSHSSVGSIDVTNQGLIATELNAIDILHEGTGDVTVGLAAGSATIAGDAIFNGAAGLTDADGVRVALSASAVGDISITSNGLLLATQSGIRASHAGTGAIAIASGTEPVSGDFGGGGLLGAIASHDTGIDAFHTGRGDLTVDHGVSGMMVSGVSGIVAVHTGAGALAVTNQGMIRGVALNGDDLDDEAEGFGILAGRSTRGNVTVENGLSGTIAGYDVGIQAFHSVPGEPTFGTIGVVNAGTINAGSIGVMARHDGYNGINITNTGSITAGEQAIAAYHYNDGDIVLTNGSLSNQTASLDAYDGILAEHYGYGDIVATNYGVITGSSDGGNGGGVGGLHYGEGGIVIANALGATVSGDFALWAAHHGEGAISIENSGTVEAEHVGIYAFHGPLSFEDDVAPINGDILIANAGAVHSQSDAIHVAHFGTGLIDIRNSAGGTLSAENYDGIAVYRGHTGLISVGNAGSINAGRAGISIWHTASGNVSVENSGTIVAEQVGIAVNLEGDGDITIASSGSVSGGVGHAISAELYGAGDIRITAVDALSRGNEYYSGINAENYGSGDVTITTNGNVAGHRAGIDAWAFDGDIFIANESSGHIRNISGRTSDLAITSGASYAPDSWNSDLGAYESFGSASTVLTNNGAITGTVDFSFTDFSQTVTFTNNGLWDSTNGTNFMGYGDDTVTIGAGGVWNATGSVTYFDGAAPLLTGMVPFVMVAGNDVLTIDEGGRLAAGGASFIGLETLAVNGLLTTVNGIAGEETYTDGDLAFGANAQLTVEASAANGADRVVADGNITIDGGTVQVVHVGTARAAVGDSYTIVESAGGEISGEFDTAEIASTAFLGWEVGYTDTAVNLTYAQLHALEEAAQTPNQSQVAGALDGLSATNPLRVEALNLGDFAAARTAFNGLSGEIHPGARTAIMQDARLPRNAVLERLQTPQGGAIWGQGFWNSGKTDGAKSGNTAKVDQETWGVIAGADLALGENAVLGIAGSYLSSDLAQPERNAKGKADTIHALGYIGTTMGAANLKAGLGYAWGDVETTRGVKLGALSNTLTADYDATLLQAFAEASFRVGLGQGYVEPMANVTYLKAKSDAFTETGGPAALTAASASQDNTLLTLGSRFATAKKGAFSVRGMAGWQHVFGNLIPTNSFTFAGGDRFTVAGVAQSRDAAVVNMEANFDLSSGAALGIGYDGVVGRDSQDHAAKLSLRIKF